MYNLFHKTIKIKNLKKIPKTLQPLAMEAKSFINKERFLKSIYKKVNNGNFKDFQKIIHEIAKFFNLLNKRGYPSNECMGWYYIIMDFYTISVKLYA